MRARETVVSDSSRYAVSNAEDGGTHAASFDLLSSAITARKAIDSSMAPAPVIMQLWAINQISESASHPPGE